MKVSMVSLNTFKSQNSQIRSSGNVNPYLYTGAPQENKPVNKHGFMMFMGVLATCAVALTLVKIAGKKLF